MLRLKKTVELLIIQLHSIAIEMQLFFVRIEIELKWNTMKWNTGREFEKEIWNDNEFRWTC